MCDAMVPHTILYFIISPVIANYGQTLKIIISLSLETITILR